MKIGLKIKELRIDKGMTQEKLAEKTELTTRTIQRIENGEVDPRAHSLQVIANALDVDFQIFIEKDSDVGGDENIARNNNWLALIHLSGIFHLFLPTILLWHLKKDTIKGITKHFQDVITFQLFCWPILIIPGFLIYWKFNKPHYLIIGLIMSGIASIDNGVKVFNNKSYQYSFWKPSKKKKNQE